MEQTAIATEGMSCGHYVASVKGALGRLEGVEVQAVKGGSATAVYDPRALTAGHIAQAIEVEGYAARVPQG
jgi:copper chaperone CopZ